MSEVRWGLIRKGTLIALASVLTAIALEGWHTAVRVCNGFTRPSILTVCTHPPVFWLLDFSILAATALILGLSLLAANEAVRFGMTGKARPPAGGTSRLDSGIAEGKRVLIGLTGMGIIYLVSLSVPFLSSVGSELGLPDPWWGIAFILLLTAPPVLGVYGFLLAIELRTSTTLHPLATGMGALVGAMVGLNFIGSIGSISIFALVTVLFAYSSYVLGRFTRPSEGLSRTGAIWHAVASSGLLIPLALPFQEISVLVMSLYVLLLIAIAVRSLIPHEVRSPSN